MPAWQTSIGLGVLACLACKPRDSTRQAPQVTISDGDDWIRPMANGRYLETGAGEPFLLIGNQPGTGFLDLPDAEIEAHFARMETAGENVARIDLDYGFPPQAGHSEPARYVGLESPLGVFDPARTARIDLAFALARKHHVRLLVVPFVTSPPMWETWAANPYGKLLGGPAADPHDFMVSGDARTAFARRMDWISARWGASSTLFGWDLMNEANILEAEGHRDPAGLASWIDELGGHLERTERGAFGRAHLRMVSVSELIPAPEYTFLFRAPSLDVAATHPYDFYGTTPDTFPAVVTSVVEPALTAHAKIRTIVNDLITDRRPYFENERHQNNITMLSFYREADHDMAMAELVSGAAGTGITWLVLPEGRLLPRTHFEDRHRALAAGRRALAELVRARIPAAFFTSPTRDEVADGFTSPDRTVAVMSLRRGDHAIGWILGRDDRCILAAGVHEGRAELADDDHAVLRAGLAIILWRKLLRGEGLVVDDTTFAPLVQAFKAKDLAAGRAGLTRAFAYLDTVDHGTLARLTACPALSPAVTFAMPPGRYRVDWIDDDTANVVRSDVIAAGATLAAPLFTRHLALVVAPVGP